MTEINESSRLRSLHIYISWQVHTIEIVLVQNLL